MDQTSQTATAPPEMPKEHYLNAAYTVRSWLLTLDHKRIALLYLISITVFFAVGGAAAGIIRAELLTPKGDLLQADNYNKMFTLHGVIMIFFFLIPSTPAVLGNFLLPLMIGAKDLAFPKLNLASWYVFMAGAILALIAVFTGGIDTGWTFYTPYASMYSNTQVTLAICGAFLAGFSSIFTGLNFIVTIHKMRAPGLTWFRLPLFVWSTYATSLIILLGTPVVAITLLLVVAERAFGFGVFSPELGGDPILFQHLFWFYSHPAVYIMILPAMGVASELFAAFSKKRVFGYHFVAFSSMAIALIGFLVWGHHMFVTGQSMYAGFVFSIITFLVAIPSAIKVFNWTATMYKGHIHLDSPMYFAIGFIGLFLIGGLTGLYLSSMATDVHLTDTYFVVGHFHYIMVGGAIMGYIGGLHYWWPKMTGRKYSEIWGKACAILIFLGFNATFFPQLLMGELGMPRRYWSYAAEFQIYHVMSSLGATLLAVGYLLPAFYLTYSLFRGEPAGDNPWDARGLEWQVQSPPTTFNFDQVPIVTWEPYNYEPDDHHHETRPQVGAPGAETLAGGRP